MSEKRFDFDGLFITDKGERKAFREVVDLLNSLNDENEQLRQQLKTICNTCCYDCEEKWCEK